MEAKSRVKLAVCLMKAAGRPVIAAEEQMSIADGESRGALRKVPLLEQQQLSLVTHQRVVGPLL